MAPGPWPKLVRELEGLRVRLTRSVSNGWMTIPPGTTGIISSATGWTRISFKGEACPCCGVKPLISRLSRGDMEPVA